MKNGLQRMPLVNLGKLVKYNEEQERDERGRFSSGGGVPSYDKLEAMTSIPGPLGSNGGTWKKDEESGKSYLVKPLDSLTHGYNEIAAGAVYREAGIKFPNTGIVKDSNGKSFLVSERINDLVPRQAIWWNAHPETQAKAAQGFGVDALLSHWDVHGMTGDNTLVDKGGNPVRIESGGAMAFRAQGGEKTGFSPTGAWVEPLSMRTSEQGRAMYGKMTDAQVATSLERAGNLNLGNVQSHWDSLGIPRNVSDPWMQTLQARQQQIPTLVNELRATKSK